MSSSVAAGAIRVDEWDREAAHEADDTAEASHLARREAGARRDTAVTERTAPWPQRGLNQALADLGPARPGSSAEARGWSRADQEIPVATGALSNAAPAAQSGPTKESVMPEITAAERVGLPPPPRPYLQPLSQPFDTAITSQAVLPWDDAAFSDIDPAGADIIRALASAGLHPADAASGPAFAVNHGDEHDGEGEQERPPMIIERALAEQGLGMMSVVPAERRVSPLPALAVGFSLSVLVGAALYLVMVAG